MANLDYIQHYGIIRLRAKGSGNLRVRLVSLDDISEQVLDPIPLTASNKIPITKLANFKEFRAYLELKTTEINERFEINQINIYVKPIST